MGIYYADVSFLLSIFSVEYGSIVIKRLFSVNEQKVGARQMSGYWEWSPQCCFPSTGACDTKSLMTRPRYYGCITAEEIQRSIQGGWHWQIDGARSHILLTRDRPNSKNVIGALSDVKWADLFALKGNTGGYWTLKVGNREYGGQWSPSSQSFDG